MKGKVEYVLWITMCFCFDRGSKLFPESSEYMVLGSVSKSLISRVFFGGRECNAASVELLILTPSNNLFVLLFKNLDMLESRCKVVCKVNQQRHSERDSEVYLGSRKSSSYLSWDVRRCRGRVWQTK